jgi:hypothetical protein
MSVQVSRGIRGNARCRPCVTRRPHTKRDLREAAARAVETASECLLQLSLGATFRFRKAALIATISDVSAIVSALQFREQFIDVRGMDDVTESSHSQELRGGQSELSLPEISHSPPHHRGWLPPCCHNSSEFGP